MKKSGILPLVVFSLLAGAAVAFLFIRGHSHGASSASSGSFAGDSWAIVSFDGEEDDSRVVSALAASGFYGFYSESTQVFYVDGFDGLKEMPLYRLNDVLESYDPRNDGYAEKLRSFFVRDGKRFFFLPVSGEGDRVRLEKALSGFHYDLEIPVNKKNRLPEVVLGIASVLVAFFLSREKRRFIYQVPLLAAVAWTGPLGIALACFLTGARGIFCDIWAEFVHRRGSAAPVGKFKSYRFHFLFSFLLIAAYFLVCAYGGVLLVPVVLVFVLFFLLEFIVLVRERKMNQRIKFVAVWMLPQKSKTPLFRKPLIPFAAAVLVVLILPFFLPSVSFKPGAVPFLVEDYVTPMDYEGHLAHQHSFSSKPLGFDAGSILGYYLDVDGLISVSDSASVIPRMEAGEYPKFPLENLRIFLIEYTERAGSISGSILMEWISAVFIVLICLSGIYRQGNVYMKKPAIILDRQAAA